MDLSQAGGSAVTDYGNTMKSLRDQDQATRDFVNARQDRYLRSTQQGPDEQQQTAASGDADYSMPQAPAPAAAPATPMVGTTRPAPAVTPVRPVGAVYQGNQTDAENKRLARSGDPDSGSLPEITPTPPAVREQKRLDALRQLNPAMVDGKAGQKAPTTLAEFNAGKQALQPGWKPGMQTDMTKMVPGIQAAPASNFADALFAQESGQGAANTSAVNSKGVTGPMQMKLGTFQGAVKMGLVPGVEPTEAAWRDPDTNTRVGKAYANYLMGKYNDPAKAAAAYFAGESAVDSGRLNPNASDGNTTVAKYVQSVLTRLAPGQNAQAAEAPAQPTAQAPTQAQAPAAQAGAPAAPAQGPTFVAANGSKFTLPQQYSDGQIQQMQQQAIQAKNALQLEWLRYQNGTSPDNSRVQQAQAHVQQLSQGLYDADIYAKTQQAQAGNPQAFSALLNEYSNKVGQPIQVVPEGNGSYSLRAKGGQVIAHGDPSALAGTLGGVLNSAARANAIKLAQIHAEESAKATAVEGAKQPVEMAKLQTELAKQLGINASQEVQKRIESGATKVTQGIDGSWLITDPLVGKFQVVNPTKPNLVGGPTVSGGQMPR